MRRAFFTVFLLAAGPASIRADNTANPGQQYYPFKDLMMDFAGRPMGELKQTMDDEPIQRVMYNKNQVWKTCTEKWGFHIELMGMRRENMIMTWGGNYTCTDMVVRAEYIDEVRDRLKGHGVDYEVLILDLQEAIDKENPPLEDLELDNRLGHRLTWHAYHRLNDIYGYLDFLADTYPDLCSVKTIGHSRQNRPLKVLKISDGKPGNKAVWIDGGMHAREWISPATATFIINEIVSKRDLKSVDWYILPLANPDGYEYSHTVDRLWRKNRRGSGYCAGVDLNRNFGYKWGGQGASGNPCVDTFRGAAAFSEPETSAIRDFMTGNAAKWKAYISLHSYGQYVLYPWGYDHVQSMDYPELNRVGMKAVSAIRQAGGPTYSLGSSGRLLYPASGGSDDWAKGNLGIKYSYTIELRDDGRYGFILPASYIQQTAKEAYAAVNAIVSEAIKS